MRNNKSHPQREASIILNQHYTGSYAHDSLIELISELRGIRTAVQCGLLRSDSIKISHEAILAVLDTLFRTEKPQKGGQL